MIDGHSIGHFSKLPGSSGGSSQHFEMRHKIDRATWDLERLGVTKQQSIDNLFAGSVTRSSVIHSIWPCVHSVLLLRVVLLIMLTLMMVRLVMLLLLMLLLLMLVVMLKVLVWRLH